MLMKKASLICDCLTNFLCPTAINGLEGKVTDFLAAFQGGISQKELNSAILLQFLMGLSLKYCLQLLLCGKSENP